MIIKLVALISIIGLVWASDVLELKDSDFESRVRAYDIALVEFCKFFFNRFIFLLIKY